MEVGRRAIEQEDSYVERLLETKNQLQDQLNDLSSEHNSEENPLPQTLGELQMKHLGGWTSIRNVLERNKHSLPAGNTISNSKGVNECSSEPLTSSGDSPKLSPLSRFSPVYHLKEYLKTNIQILQDQIDWNNEKLMTEDNSVREQGTGMTPKVMVDQGTSVNDFPLPEPHNNTRAKKQSSQQCIHCFKKGHTVYECDKPEKEKMIAFMHRQESLLDKYKAQRSEKLACDPQKLDAIATTKRLTNPSGKGWTTPYENLMPPVALSIKQTPQSREGNWAGRPLIKE